MLTELDRDDVEMLRGLLQRERLRCVEGETVERKERALDVAEAWRARNERCQRLAAVLAEPDVVQLVFRNPPAPREGAR